MFAGMMRWGAESGQRLYDGQGPWVGHPMMWWTGSSSGAFWVFGILWLVTWLLVIVVLVALVRWIWKKGDKVK